jgi:hypothetical protein
MPSVKLKNYLQLHLIVFSGALLFIITVIANGVLKQMGAKKNV